MNNKSKYSSRNILKIGAICITTFSCFNLFSGLIGIYYYPHSTGSIIELVLWRTGFIFVSYLFSGLLIYYKRENLEKVFPVWLSLPFLGFISLTLNTFGYLIMSDFFIELNCSSAEFSGCNYLTDIQFGLSISVSIILGFAVTTGLILLIGFISNLIPKKINLK